ncbi:hypothetical protein GCM10028791_15040 [Echinicola sediminis]
MKHFSQLLFFYLCCILGQQGFSQTDQQTDQGLVSAYKKIIPFPQEVFSGGQYAVGEAFHIEGSPFLISNDFVKGQITINGFTYTDILLNYDIQKDQLITYHPNNFQRIVLNAQKINSFVLPTNRKFIKSPVNQGYAFHKSGYYEVLWDQKLIVLVKHTKEENLKKDYNASASKHFEFSYRTHYFIEIGDKFYRINNKKDLAKALGISKRQINRSLKKAKLKYKKQTASSLVNVAANYVSDFDNN